MPTSYQAPMTGDKDTHDTVSQSLETNLKTDPGTVQTLLNSKGNKVITITESSTLQQAVELLRDNRIGALIVVDDTGLLRGILSERDIVRKLADTPGQTLPQSVADNMTRDVVTCRPDEALINVLKRMSEGRFRHMPVLDGADLVGMVTIGDVVNFRLTEVEP